MIRFNGVHTVGVKRVYFAQHLEYAIETVDGRLGIPVAVLPEAAFFNLIFHKVKKFVFK